MLFFLFFFFFFFFFHQRDIFQNQSKIDSSSKIQKRQHHIQRSNKNSTVVIACTLLQINIKTKQNKTKQNKISLKVTNLFSPLKSKDPNFFLSFSFSFFFIFIIQKSQFVLLRSTKSSPFSLEFNPQNSWICRRNAGNWSSISSTTATGSRRCL